MLAAPNLFAVSELRPLPILGLVLAAQGSAEYGRPLRLSTLSAASSDCVRTFTALLSDFWMVLAISSAAFTRASEVSASAMCV